MNLTRFITTFGLIFFLTWAKGPIQRYVIMKELTQCHEYGNLSAQIQNVSVYQAQRNIYKISGEITYKERISHGAKVFLDIAKCPDTTGDIENCKQFIPRITINNLCDIIDIEESFVSKFFSRMEPACKCPFYGKYQMNGIPIDSEIMNYLPIGNIQTYYVTVTGEHKSKTFICIKFYIQIRPRRS